MNMRASNSKLTDLSVLFMLYSIINYYILSMLSNTSTSTNLFNYLGSSSFKSTKVGFFSKSAIINNYLKLLVLVS